MNAFYLQKESEVGFIMEALFRVIMSLTTLYLVLAATENASRQEACGSVSDQLELQDPVELCVVVRRLPAIRRRLEQIAAIRGNQRNGHVQDSKEMG